MLNLEVITASTREGRSGPLVADWFTEVARKHNNFNVIPVDLAEVKLPLFDEPRHPRFGQYEHAHTKRWSEIILQADAFVFVTPEYNYSAPPSLLNALTFLSKEWNYKPVGFVSYGGVSAGTRSVQVTKGVVTSLKMMPLPEAVSIPFFNQFIDQDSGSFRPPETQEQAANTMLDELYKWATALKTMRPQPAIVEASVAASR